MPLAQEAAAVSSSPSPLLRYVRSPFDKWPQSKKLSLLDAKATPFPTETSISEASTLGNNMRVFGYMASVMKRAVPSEQAYTVSSDSSCSESEGDGSTRKKPKNKGHIVSVIDGASQGGIEPANKDADALIRQAEMYQEYMRIIPIPHHQGSVIPFKSWQGLAKSMKQIYCQPLHYLTNVILKQWDQQRVGTEDEHLPLDAIIHPTKAETLIWVTEEVHRLTCSHHHLAKLWAFDPMYHAFIDSVFPDVKLIAQETHLNSC